MLGSEAFLKALKARVENDSTSSSSSLSSETISCGPYSVEVCVDTSRGVGGHVWEASIELARWCGPQLVKKKVLELGSGTGAAGLLIAKMGADVTMTDRWDVIPLLKESLKKNASSLTSHVEVKEMTWGEESNDDANGDDVASGDGSWDAIVASECVYNGHLYDRLMTTIKREMSRTTTTTTAQLFMSFERRSSEERWLKMVREEFKNVHVEIIKVNDKEITLLKCSNA